MLREEEEDDLFQVTSYRLDNEVLEIKLLNKDLVDDDLTGSEAIKKAFLKNKDHVDLFNNPGKFRKIDD